MEERKKKKLGENKIMANIRKGYRRKKQMIA